MLYCLFLYGMIARVFKNIPVRSGGWGQLTSVHLRTMGEGSQLFAILVGTYQLNDPKVLNEWYTPPISMEDGFITARLCFPAHCSLSGFHRFFYCTSLSWHTSLH